MTEEVHPLVTLLVARAKSHPEEFNEHRDTIGKSDRWWQAVSTVSRNGTDADKALMTSVLGRIAMDTAHEWVLDELLNGDERREAERHEAILREKEETEKRFAQMLGTMGQNSTSLSAFAQAQRNACKSALANASISGITNQVVITDSTNLGGETLAAGMFKQIKKALGVK